MPRGRIARDTAWNFAGQVAPLVVGVFAVPVVVRHLSAAEFGLLGAAWALLGYFGLLDLGLGRATTRFVAAALASPTGPRPRRIVALATAGSAVLGVVGGALVALFAPLLARGLLRLRGPAGDEATAVFVLLAAGVPFTLLAQAFRAVLEGARRFDLVNAIKAPANALTFLLPAAGAMAGLGVRGIVFLLVISRGALALALWIAVERVVPRERSPAPEAPGLFAEFARFSGWVAVSSILSPLLVYAERFVLGAVSGLAALAYYTPPAEAATRVLVVPSSVANALFPVFSVAGDSGEHAGARRLVVRAVALLAALLVLPTVLVVLFAHPLLTLWLGPEFGARGALALQILVVGIFANALAHIPYGYLQGIGRPDLTAKLHLVEVPIYAALVWWLVNAYGVPGAALAWTARLVGDAAGLFVLAWRQRQPRGAASRAAAPSTS